MDAQIHLSKQQKTKTKPNSEIYGMVHNINLMSVQP